MHPGSYNFIVDHIIRDYRCIPEDLMIFPQRTPMPTPTWRQRHQAVIITLNTYLYTIKTIRPKLDDYHMFDLVDLLSFLQIL